MLIGVRSIWLTGGMADRSEGYIYADRSEGYMLIGVRGIC